MTYTTNEEVIARYDSKEILQVAGDGVTLDSAKMLVARAGAYNLINSHLGTKYVLPITASVPVLKDCEADLTRYFLYDDNPTIHVVDRFNYWTVWLADVAKGRIQLYTDTDQLVTKTGFSGTGSDGFFGVNAATKVFTEDVKAASDLTSTSPFTTYF